MPAHSHAFCLVARNKRSAANATAVAVVAKVAVAAVADYFAANFFVPEQHTRLTQQQHTPNTNNLLLLK